MRNPETVAAVYHWSHVGFVGALFLFALGGLYGHYRLRKSYARWHLSQPDIRIA